MEESKALKDVENSLRDFIDQIMSERNGVDWINDCGITKERIKAWEDRREEELKKQKFGTAESRIIYYSQFFELAIIIKKNWDSVFSSVFGDQRSTLLFLDYLNDYRDADAHRRELLPHQKHLIIGMSEEIRNRIVLFRSKKETGADYFPRIESVRDNLGNIATPEKSHINTKLVLRSGDKLTFVITASDPLGETLEYGYKIDSISKPVWESNNIIEIELTDKDIGISTWILIAIRSKREYLASGWFDDCFSLKYTILPKK